MGQEVFLISTPCISIELAGKILSGKFSPDDVYKMYGVATPLILPVAEKIRPGADFLDDLSEVLFSSTFALICFLDDYENNITANPKIGPQEAKRVKDFLHYASAKAQEERTPFSYADLAIRFYAIVHPGPPLVFEPYPQQAEGPTKDAEAEAVEFMRRQSTRTLERMTTEEALQ